MRQYSFIIVLILTLFSCSKSAKQDSEPPVIEQLITLNSDNVMELFYPIGASVKFHTTITDNEELGSYRMEVHYAGDGHRHYRLEPTPNKATSLENWEFDVSDNFSGKSKTFSISRTIDDDAKASPYHAIMYATDDAGNYADFQIKEFFITRTDMPSFNIISPDFTNLKVPLGSDLIVQGEVKADLGITKIQLISRPLEINSPDEVINKSTDYDGTNITIAFNDTINIPMDTALGEYVILLLASDKGDSVGQFLETFEIVE